MDRVAGIDLGATRCRVAVADREGTILARTDGYTPQGPTGTDVTASILDALRTVVGEVGIEPTDLAGVGIGSIGPLERGGGAVARGVNLDGEVGRIPLREPLEDLIDGPVFVHNDAVAGAIGEQAALADPPDNLVYVTISTGIGVGAIVDGCALSGRDGNAAEMGHVVVDPDGRLDCGCGAEGHWEAYCSGRNLPAFAGLLADETADTGLDLDGLTAAELFDARADPLAERTIRAMTRYNAIGLAATVHAFAPDIVTVGGAVALANPGRVIDPLSEAISPFLAVPTPDIRPATLDEDSVLVGAIASVRRATTP